MITEIEQYIHDLDGSKISLEKQTVLNSITAYLRNRLMKNERVALMFICTHNSRRSQFAQVWAHALAEYFELTEINAYSAGTEVTALYPEVANTLQRIGFEVDQFNEQQNPVYCIRLCPKTLPLIAFSKQIEHPFNPTTDFIAIMTCNQANETCPNVLGASKRFALTYTDPKFADGTDTEQQTYAATSKEIARELKYVFQRLKSDDDNS